MQVIVKPSKLNGILHVPASKSMMQRACAAALLHNGSCLIHNIGMSDDDKVAMSIIKQLGAKINNKSTASIEVISDGVITTEGNIYCGESGLSTRLFTIIAALSHNEITVTGSGSLLKRSMIPFKELFAELGVAVKDFDGKLPITIQGPLIPRSISIDGSLSSQFLSGLLIAYAFTAKQEVTIKAENLVSRPYIDITLEVLKSFCIVVANNDYKEFVISPLKTDIKDIVIDIEGDWSSAAYWLVAGAINGQVSLKGLNVDSSQADRAILSVLKESGVNYTIDEDRLTVIAPFNSPRCFSFDATNAPDLFPILAIYASLCTGESKIKGLHRLHQKESDRSESIKKMLEGFGVLYHINNDTLLIKGQEILQKSVVDSYNDHRIAMAATIGALCADGACIIKQAESVNKSYPNFFQDLKELGAICTAQ